MLVILSIVAPIPISSLGDFFLNSQDSACKSLHIQKPKIKMIWPFISLSYLSNITHTHAHTQNLSCHSLLFSHLSVCVPIVNICFSAHHFSPLLISCPLEYMTLNYKWIRNAGTDESLLGRKLNGSRGSHMQTVTQDKWALYRLFPLMQTNYEERLITVSLKTQPLEILWRQMILLGDKSLCRTAVSSGRITACFKSARGAFIFFSFPLLI